MFLRSVQRWRGVILTAAIVAATAWLAVSGQLVLYIHPRYIVFTVVMAVIALALSIAAVLVQPHDDDDEAQRPGGLGIAAVVVAAVFVVGLVALPPATLSAETASQRDIVGSTAGSDAQLVEDADAAPTEAFAKFTVVDWSSLLRQTGDLEFYAGKPVDVVGFIVADADAPQDVFLVSRFIVTCCAVDAQPVGVPVYSPGWQQRLAVDDWVRVTGEFTTNPAAASTQPLAIDPAAVEIVEQPSEPYLY